MRAPIPIRPCSIRSSPTASSRRWRMPGTVGGRSGWTPRHLVLKDAATSDRRLRALLPEVAQPGRVRVRPLLGRGLRAGRRALLSQAADRGAVHAGARAPAAGAARVPMPRPTRRVLAAAAVQLVERNDLSGLHITFASEGEWERLGEPRLPQAHRPAVPLEQCRLRHLRRLPGLARVAQAQGGAQGARARRVGDRPHHRMGTRPRHHGGALGRVLRLLHGHGLAQVGAALSQPQGRSR